MVDKRGRPRSFDKKKALEQALGLFWQQGYLGTSYSDLCAETDLTKPSLYAAFGNKEATFLAALDLYVARYVQPGIDALQSDTDAREAVHKLLTETVKGLTSKDTPPGCMIATNIACIEASDIPQSVATALKDAAQKTPTAIEHHLRKAQAAGQLPPDTNHKALTAFLSTLITGLSGLAKQSTSKAKLLQAVNTAMLVWPKDTAD